MVDRRVTVWCHALAAAFQFLTRIPVPVRVDFSKETAARSVVFFPAAGAVIGLIVSFSFFWGAELIPPMPAAVIVLALWTALSGGLHLDGWMDTADGLLSHRSRERMLEIMRDSRVGAMGVIAGVLLLLFKFSLISELLSYTLNAKVIMSLISIPVWSRLALATAVGGWPLAREREGMAALFGKTGIRHWTGSCCLTLVFVLSGMFAVGFTFYETLEHIVVNALITGGVTAGMAFWFRRKLGGLTGDTYGAVNEAVEAVLLLSLVVGWTG